MSTHDEIGKAISAHSAWKQKLRNAIETGESDSTPDKVRGDCNCAFGKWLHKIIDPVEKDSTYYAEVVDLHAHFHTAAGTILEHALNGNKDEADELMSLSGDFTKYSSELTRKMKEWQSTL